MKKTYLSLIALFAVLQVSHAQWTNGTNISNTNAGNVGIGTTNPYNKLTVTAGENNRAIEITGGANYFYNETSTSHFLPALSYYAYQSLIRSSPSSEIAFIDRPGTSGYPNAARTSDIVFYTAHSYNSASNSYGIYPDLTMVLKSNQDGGYVGIGTANPDQKLSVNGTIHSKKVLVDLNGWSDYVLKPGYKLPKLSEVKAFIDENQHLPGIPSEKELQKTGVDVNEIMKLQMKKIEELTLYLIEKDKQDKEKDINLQAQNKLIQQQESRIKALEAKIPN